jgi:hypothetical protein
MIELIRQFLAAKPFEPFIIVSTGGNKYRVASHEHAAIGPRDRRVVVWFDNGGEVTIAALHIASVEKEPAQAT